MPIPPKSSTSVARNIHIPSTDAVVLLFEVGEVGFERCGLSRHAAPPVAVLVGPAGHDRRLLEVVLSAAARESATPARSPARDSARPASPQRSE